jgi:hypothetical protein
MISMMGRRRSRKKKPWERKIPVKSGPPEKMLLDDALERFIDEWIVFKITKPEDWTGNHEGFVIAHGGPEKPMLEIAEKIWTAEPGGRLVVEFCGGRPIRTGEEARRAIEEYFETHDYEEWLDVYR